MTLTLTILRETCKAGIVQYWTFSFVTLNNIYIYLSIFSLQGAKYPCTLIHPGVMPTMQQMYL